MPTPAMPQTQAEWEAHWAFYILTIAERDQARNQVRVLQERLAVMTQIARS